MWPNLRRSFARMEPGRYGGNQWERGSNVTVMCAMNAADGFGVPHFFIFPRKRMNAAFMANTPPGSVGHCNEKRTSYMDSTLFVTWLHHFAQYTKCTKDKPHILIIDGHESHKTLDAVDFCRNNRIILISLPPHSTHRMQPLDCTFLRA